MADRIDLRTLNRTLLARQWLHPVAPAGSSVHAVVQQLVGVQAQDVTAPYVGIWSRLPGFAHAELGDALLDRSLVRIVTMRGTVHLHTAADARPVREWVQPVLDGQLRGSRRALWEAVDRAALVAETRALLQDAPMVTTELGAALAVSRPGLDPLDLHQCARCFLPMVQVPPRGVWGRSGRTTYLPADVWLTEPAQPLHPATIIGRYLAAFGPASVADVQTWSGLTRLREVTAAMDLRHYTDDDGVDLLDLPELPLVDPDTPVPPVFTAPFDNVTLSHADRRRVIDAEGRRRVSSLNGMIPGMVLLDGFVAATWRVEKRTLQVTPFGRISKRVAAGLTRPGRRLLRFLAGEAGEVVVRPSS